MCNKAYTIEIRLDMFSQKNITKLLQLDVDNLWLRHTIFFAFFPIHSELHISREKCKNQMSFFIEAL